MLAALRVDAPMLTDGLREALSGASQARRFAGLIGGVRCCPALVGPPPLLAS